MITFGITGGIACGKSTVTRIIRSLGVPVVDADMVARDVVVPGSPGLRQITDVFGIEYLQSNGELDRAKLAALVFHHSVDGKLALQKLNNIMTPLINQESDSQIKRYHSFGHKVVAYDAALIIEMGNANKYRPLVVVACPQEMQIERMMKRNGVTRQDALARIAHQTTTEHKIKLADYVIDSSGSLEESKKQTKDIIYRIRKSQGRFCWDCGREYNERDKSIMCEGCGYDNPFEN